MKKKSLFLSLLLTVVGTTTTQAQKLLTPSDLTDGRVITLKACDATNQRYMKATAAGSETFDPRETVFVIEEAEKIPQENSEESNEEKTFYFYLKKFDGTYLKKTAEAGTQITPTEGNTDAAVFHAVKVSRSTNSSDDSFLNDPKFSGDVTEDDVIRFVTTATATNGVQTTVFFNCQGANDISKYMTGKGTWSVFCVYDAAELCCEEYGKNLGEQPVYVGDPIHSEIQEQAMSAAYKTYDDSYSEANYNAVLTAAESDKGKFNSNLYYVIENNYNRGTYMEATNEGKLGWSSSLSGSASQIWQFQPEETTDKYFMTTQGVFCSEAERQTQVSLGKKDAEKTTSYFLIEASTGVYAFDCKYNDIRSVDGDNGNGGTGLQKNGNTVWGWGTAAGAAKWKLKYVDVYDLVVSTAGWASLNLPFSVKLPEGLTAYYAAGTTEQGDAIVLQEAGPQIPANFPVVIESKDEITESEGKTFSLTILPADTQITSPAENQFQGTLLPAEPENAGSVYALGLVEEDVYFCKLNTENSTIAANKAYYEASDTNGVNALRFAFGTTTGIAGTSASAPSENNVWFDLKGRRVLYPSTGIYVNGKGEKVLFQ